MDTSSIDTVKEWFYDGTKENRKLNSSRVVLAAIGGLTFLSITGRYATQKFLKLSPQSQDLFMRTGLTLGSGITVSYFGAKIYQRIFHHHTKSPAQFIKIDQNLTWDHLGGYKKAKEKGQDFLAATKSEKPPFGSTPLTALLLDGPSGTGKTLFAKIIASMSNASFLKVSGSAFEEIYVGTGPSRVKALFQQADSNRPCIIFIDEVDGAAMQRQESQNNYRQTLNTLLDEIEGFKERREVFVIVATNEVTHLDAAFKNRFILAKMDLPTEQERLEILKIIAKDMAVRHESQSVIENEDDSLRKLAKATKERQATSTCPATKRVAGRRLKEILDEAARKAKRENPNAQVIPCETLLKVANEKIIEWAKARSSKG